MGRVIGIRLRRNAVGGQVSQSQAQRERGRNSLAVVEIQQSAAYHAVLIGRDVRKPDALGAAQDCRASNPFAGVLAELLDEHHARIAGQQGVQLVGAGRHRDVAIQVHAHRARAMDENLPQRLGHAAVRERPLAELLNVLLDRLHQHDPRLAHALALLDAQVDVVRRQFHELQQARAAHADHEQRRGEPQREADNCRPVQPFKQPGTHRRPARPG